MPSRELNNTTYVRGEERREEKRREDERRQQ
jgi:hypothetical protein